MYSSSDPRRCYNDSMLRYHTGTSLIPDVFKASVCPVLCDFDIPCHRKGSDADGGSVRQSYFHSTEAVGFSNIVGVFLRCRVSILASISIV
jgi:hypothetical protein